MPYSTSTPALSTSSSSRGLTLTMGYLILRGASRLDAFSVYPVPTWLPGRGVDRQPVHQRSVHPCPLVLRTAPLRSATDRCFGRPLPCQLANQTRVHPVPPEFLPLHHAVLWSYAVLAAVSSCCPPVQGRLPTRYSPVRH